MKRFVAPEVEVLKLATESILDVNVGAEEGSGNYVTMPEV